MNNFGLLIHIHTGNCELTIRNQYYDRLTIQSYLKTLKLNIENSISNVCYTSSCSPVMQK